MLVGFLTLVFLSSRGHKHVLSSICFKVVFFSYLDSPSGKIFVWIEIFFLHVKTRNCPSAVNEYNVLSL